MATSERGNGPGASVGRMAADRHVHRHERARRAVAIAAAALLVAVACVKRAPTPDPRADLSMGPVTTSDRVAYTVPAEDALTAAEAVALEARIRVDQTTGEYAVAALPTCTAATAPETGWRCSAALPAATVDRINVVGTHQVRVFTYIPAPPPPPPEGSKAGESPASEPPWTITTAQGQQPPPPPAAPVGSRFVGVCLVESPCPPR